MTVTVLLFASYADALGKSAIELDVAPGSTVRDILGTLFAMPGGAAPGGYVGQSLVEGP